MKQKRFFTVLILLSVLCFSKSNGQTMLNKTIYLNASAGLSRSEDGLDFMVKNSASQWVPMLNIGAGYRINKYFGLEFNTATMLGELKADGTSLSGSQKISVTTRHSNLAIGPILYLPFSEKSEIFFRPNAAILLSTSKLSSTSNPNFEKSTSNFGFMITLGYAQKISSRMSLTTQFDFSDPYGIKEVWEGDLGLLTFGIKYSLNKK